MSNPVVYVLLAVLGVREIMHYLERRDLYSRIMARDLTDYKKADNKHGKVQNLIRKNFEKYLSDQ